MPVIALEVLAFSLMIYQLVGFRDGILSARFGFFFVCLMQVAFIGRSFSVLLSFLMPTEAATQAAGTLIIGFAFLTAGSIYILIILKPLQFQHNFFCRFSSSVKNNARDLEMVQ
jgi:hypothetical protein